VSYVPISREYQLMSFYQQV